jgi:hypothetical protein
VVLAHLGPLKPGPPAESQAPPKRKPQHTQAEAPARRSPSPQYFRDTPSIMREERQ